MLVGREGELGQIDGLLGRVTTGSGAVAMVEGAAGIGKTALLADAAARAVAAGCRVLRAAGGQLEQEYAFGVVRQLFAGVIAGGGSARLSEGAAGLAARPLGLVVDAGGSAPAGDDAGSSAMHGLYWLTANLAERGPVLLVIDDVHWAVTPEDEHHPGPHSRRLERTRQRRLRAPRRRLAALVTLGAVASAVPGALVSTGGGSGATPTVANPTLKSAVARHATLRSAGRGQGSRS